MTALHTEEVSENGLLSCPLQPVWELVSPIVFSLITGIVPADNWPEFMTWVENVALY